MAGAALATVVAERKAIGMGMGMGMERVIQEYEVNAKPYDFEVSDSQNPLILLHGDCDMHNPLGGAKLLAQHAPNVELHILKDMGHLHLFVEWDWIFEAVMGFPINAPQAVRRSHGSEEDAV